MSPMLRRFLVANCHFHLTVIIGGLLSSMCCLYFICVAQLQKLLSTTFFMLSFNILATHFVVKKLQALSWLAWMCSVSYNNDSFSCNKSTSVFGFISIYTSSWSATAGPLKLLFTLWTNLLNLCYVLPFHKHSLTSNECLQHICITKIEIIWHLDFLYLYSKR